MEPKIKIEKRETKTKQIKTQTFHHSTEKKENLLAILN